MHSFSDGEPHSTQKNVPHCLQVYILDACSPQNSHSGITINSLLFEFVQAVAAEPFTLRAAIFAEQGPAPIAFIYLVLSSTKFTNRHP